MPAVIQGLSTHFFDHCWKCVLTSVRVLCFTTADTCTLANRQSHKADGECLDFSFVAGVNIRVNIRVKIR